MNDKLESQLEAALLEHADLSDGSHDLSHIRRVKRIAIQIAERARCGDHQILIAAAYLHDLVNLPKSHPDIAPVGKCRAPHSKRDGDDL
jgi:uncharacterized protein